MDKKVLFVFPSYGIGGTTVSTSGLISVLEKEGYDCWIMPLVPKGEMHHLFDNAKQIETPFVIRALSIDSWKDEPFALNRLVVAVLRFLRNHSLRFEHRIVGKAFDKLIRVNNFNTVIACQEAFPTRFVSYVSLCEKIAWVRCDYKRLIEDGARGEEIYYQKFKAIICVSDQTCKSFKSIFPEFRSKTYCIPNPQDVSIIKKQAYEVEKEPRFVMDGKILVSIGRFDPVKRFDKIAPIASELINNGLSFRWYLIGDGNERQRIEASIKQYHVEDYVILLGVKTNPYYYIRSADMMVCLSRSEACPRVVNEAKILLTPTVSTDFPTIFEFIEDGKTGLVSTLDELPSRILSLCNDVALSAKIKENISQFVFDNTGLITALKKIL